MARQQQPEPALQALKTRLRGVLGRAWPAWGGDAERMEKRDCTRWLSSVNPYIGPFPYRMPSTLLWFISNTCIKRLVVVCAIQGYYASHKPLASVVGEIRRWAHHFFTALAGLQTGGIRHVAGGCLLAVSIRIRHLYYPPVDPAAAVSSRSCG